MTYSRSPSATKKAPSVALSHAAASFRVCATASSCSLPRILTTQEWASKSASAPAMARKYRRRALGLSVCKCARSITAVSVNSVDGAGSSPMEMGCAARLLGMVTLTAADAPRRLDSITHGHAFPRKGKNRSTVSVNHEGKKAGSSPAPFCCSVSILPRQTPQRPRRDFILGGRRRFFAAVSASFPFSATDFHTPSKATENHVAHLSALKSAPSLGTPAT